MIEPQRSTPPDESSIIARAGEERRRFRHDYLGTEHILLALVSGRSGPVAVILGEAGLRRSDIVAQIQQIVPEGSRTTVGRVTVTPMARTVIEGAGRIAQHRGAAHVGPEHYLHALLTETDSVAVEIIQRLEIDLNTLRDRASALIDSAPEGKIGMAENEGDDAEDRRTAQD